MSATAAVKVRRFVREMLELSSIEPGHRASLVPELRSAFLRVKQTRGSDRGEAKIEVYKLLDLTELSYGGQLALLEAIAEF